VLRGSDTKKVYVLFFVTHEPLRQGFDCVPGARCCAAMVSVSRAKECIPFGSVGKELIMMFLPLHELVIIFFIQSPGMKQLELRRFASFFRNSKRFCRSQPGFLARS